MVPIMSIIEQRIIYYEGLVNLEDAGDERPQENLVQFARQFAQSDNDKDQDIRMLYQASEDELDVVFDFEEAGEEEKCREMDDIETMKRKFYGEIFEDTDY